MGEWLNRWGRYLSEPVDAASLAVVRIVLGVDDRLGRGALLRLGWIAEYYILPKWHFTYLYFDWVRPWPGDWMYVHFAVIVALRRAGRAGAVLPRRHRRCCSSPTPTSSCSRSRCT